MIQSNMALSAVDYVMLPVGMQYISSGLAGTCGSGDCYDTLWLILDKGFFEAQFWNCKIFM